MKIFLCGDIMTGRGIDQILPHPSKPHLYEPYVRDAREYITIAENRNGPIPRHVTFEYIWGDALSLLQKEMVDVRIVNLETSITRSDNYWPHKGINYRMNPENIKCLSIADIDCCVLSNNHTIDWGYEGLETTLSTLDNNAIAHAGAGLNACQSLKPAIIDRDELGRVLVFAFGAEDSGIPRKWEATANKPGVAMITEFSTVNIKKIADYVKNIRKKNDYVIVSIHWGENWGYDIPRAHVDFAHALIDNCGIDCIHGHSSHHPKGIEIYHNKLILYGCGDLINDYEGIYGYEEFKADLSILYIISVDKSGQLNGCKMIPLKLHRFRLNVADEEARQWFIGVFNGPAGIGGTRVIADNDSSIELVLV